MPSLIAVSSPLYGQESKRIMPITDATKKQMAQKRRLFFKICLRCGSKNPISATRCRKCHAQALRLKNRALGVKK